MSIPWKQNISKYWDRQSLQRLLWCYFSPSSLGSSEAKYLPRVKKSKSKRLIAFQVIWHEITFQRQRNEMAQHESAWKALLVVQDPLTEFVAYIYATIASTLSLRVVIFLAEHKFNRIKKLNVFHFSPLTQNINTDFLARKLLCQGKWIYGVFWESISQTKKKLTTPPQFTWLHFSRSRMDGCASIYQNKLKQ